LQEEERAARITKGNEASATKEATGKTSQFFGVIWSKRMSSWKAQVRHRGKMHTIGYYDDEVAAARAVDRWLLANGRRRVNLDADDTPLEWHTTYASIYVGVTKNRGKWQARIKVGDKDEPLGSYHTQKEAALAFDRRAREVGRGTNFRKDGTCNELGKRGKVVTQVEDKPGS
jgi:hypothetical protein